MNRIFKKNEHCLFLLLVVIGLLVCGPARAEFIADGVTLVPLTDDGKSTAIAWAPHGNKILYQVRHTETQRQLFIADSDGSNAEAITPIGFPYYAEWSWAGDKVAFLYANSSSSESQSRAYVYDLNTKKTVMACEPYPRFNLDEDEGPLWSPDDRYIVFKTRRGPSRRRFVTVYDTQTKNRWDVVPERGQNRYARWSFTLPPRLTFQSEASAEHYDIAVSDPDGRNLVLLTSIGAESVSNRQPRWRPPGAYEKMIAYTSNIEMTRTERGMKRNDVWIARPDGIDARNLTQATSPSTEEQLNNDIILWSWDGRWILSRGDRFDSQAKDIHTAYLMDPINGGYKTIFTTFPRKDGLHERVHVIKWSYDSTKILMYTQRYDVKNWDTQREYQRTRHVLSLLHIDTDRRDEILVYDEELERKEILGSDDRAEIENVTFSPNGRSILLSIATIVSRDDRISRPDVYRLDLSDSLVSSEASKHIGPPVGRSAISVSNQGASPAEETPYQETRVVPTANEYAPALGDNVITETIRPLHMTADEAMESLSPEFTQYMTKNVSRNLLLFKGPLEVLNEIRRDLAKIDTPSPQILVDLLAVELADEANRSLGLDWTYAKGRFAFFQPVGNAVRDLTPDSALDGIATYPGLGQAFYQGVGKLPEEFFVRMNALVQDGKGTILANPRTVAMSGRESKIQIRRTLNYFFNEGFDVAGRPVVKKSDISSDTEGRITPTLLADGKIHMIVDVKVGSFTFTSDSGLPEQTQRDSTTEVAVSEGDTLVIGGLRQQEMVQTVSKVPLLGDLPILGWLFKQEQKEIKQSVLTLFITPHVLREGQSAPPWLEVDLKNGYTIPSSDLNQLKP
jgi:Flp pilus assembly secretin CpaC/Tol biopolymer transport system component